jgi:hypothetical protein
MLFQDFHRNATLQSQSISIDFCSPGGRAGAGGRAGRRAGGRAGHEGALKLHRGALLGKPLETPRRLAGWTLSWSTEMESISEGSISEGSNIGALISEGLAMLRPQDFSVGHVRG